MRRAHPDPRPAPPPPAGGEAREPRDGRRSEGAPRSPGPGGSGRPARPRPPLCGVGPQAQSHGLAAFSPPRESSPGDVTAAAASALPAGPASLPGASVLLSLLQDRQDFLLTARWAPSYIQPSQPMGAEYPSRENRSAGSRESCRSDLKGTFQAVKEAGGQGVDRGHGTERHAHGRPSVEAELSPGAPSQGGLLESFLNPPTASRLRPLW